MLLVADTVAIFEPWIARITAVLAQLVRYLGERDFRFSE
jgi:hypothetical protein